MSPNEGDPLTLTCRTVNAAPHTRLSVTWYLQKNGEAHAHPIASVHRNLTSTPGPRFEERFRAGAVRLDMDVERAAYRLNVDQLKLTDGGSFYCQVRQWMQDPDRSWFLLTQMDSEATVVNVTAKGELSPCRSPSQIWISLAAGYVQTLQSKVSSPCASLQGDADFVVVVFLFFSQQAVRTLSQTRDVLQWSLRASSRILSQLLFSFSFFDCSTRNKTRTYSSLAINKTIKQIVLADHLHFNNTSMNIQGHTLIPAAGFCSLVLFPRSSGSHA